MELKTICFMTPTELCDYINKHGINMVNVQSVAPLTGVRGQTDGFVLFYWERKETVKKK